MRAGRAALLLGCLGTVHIAADLAGLAPVSAVAAASGVAPAPKVFSSVRGLETFSSRFFVEWTAPGGEERSVEVTPERAAGLAGPYNRRNVWGAALAYGPLLASDLHTRPLFGAVLRAALCGEAPLLRELGIDASERVGPVRIRVAPRQRPAGAAWPSVLQGDCR